MLGEQQDACFRSQSIELEVTGNYGLFTDPITKVGGEKFSYSVPTYEALKGILESVYWKPTFIWVIDKVRIMNPIRHETHGICTSKWNATGRDLSFYSYLAKCRYQVSAHMEWNMNRPELAKDRNAAKHFDIALRSLKKGGRRDIYLGARECQGYVEPCVFGEGKGAYDETCELTFGLMYHGITYADEAHSEDTKGRMTTRFWFPKMRSGVIEFIRPDECTLTKPLRGYSVKRFGEKYNNFTSVEETEKEVME